MAQQRGQVRLPGASLLRGECHIGGIGDRIIQAKRHQPFATKSKSKLSGRLSGLPTTVVNLKFA